VTQEIDAKASAAAAPGTARNRAQGPQWVRRGLALGLFLALGAALLVLWSLDMRVTADALAHHGREIESRLRVMIERLAEEELAADGGGLDRFERRLRDAAGPVPEVTEIVVVPPGVRSDHPCVKGRSPLEASARQHAAGVRGPDPEGCLVLPVKAGGRVHGSVLLHLRREWAAGGRLVRSAVRQTAWQLAPVFLGAYVLLGAMLLLATRASERWRQRAVSLERVEAIGAMVSGIGHEIRNPLNALGLCLQELELTYPESRESVERAREQSRRIEARLDDFVRLGSMARSEFRKIDLAPRIREWTGAEVEGAAVAWIDEIQLREATESIADTLKSHAKAGDRVRVRLGAGRRIWKIRAQAAAPDLEPAAVEHLFDPYRRTRPYDVGRGLAWARAVFRAHGGDLDANYRKGRLEITGAARTRPGERA